ncbi:MAG: DNA alkylation repair protein [Bacteroidales bacterium]|nr:DNA alkylation repair protein [Bacteroidales bacterium]
MSEIRTELLSMVDTKYAQFNSQLLPTVDSLKVIGVRTPLLRQYAKQLVKSGNVDEFLLDLPHQLFEENQLHAFIISEIKSYDDCLAAVEKFLPFIDNWATCDQLTPRSFARHKQELLPHIYRWLSDSHEYTIRFGIKMLMSHFLDADFNPEYLSKVAAINRSEYYIMMMQAWYFATALAKQYEATLPVLQESWLSTWVHNKTIQKAIESYRITPEQKEFLRTLRRKE